MKSLTFRDYAGIRLKKGLSSSNRPRPASRDVTGRPECRERSASVMALHMQSDGRLTRHQLELVACYSWSFFLRESVFSARYKEARRR